MLRSLFLAFSTIAIANASTFGECSCKFKDGHVQKFQVSDCKASVCYIECRQNAGGIQESCVTKMTNRALAMACDTCITTKLADDIPADYAQFICTKVGMCIPVKAVKI